MGHSLRPLWLSSLFAVGHQILGELIQKRSVKQMVYQKSVVIWSADNDLPAGHDKAARLVRGRAPDEDERDAPAVISAAAAG